MQPTYRVAPYMPCRAPRRTFADAVQALYYGRAVAAEFGISCAVYRVLEGRLLLLWTFRPVARRA